MKAFFDISGLTNLLGISLTGIQRMEYNLSDFFLRQTDAKFCLYSKQSQSFHLIPRHLIRKLIDQIAVGGQIDLTTGSLRNQIVSQAKTPIQPGRQDTLIILRGWWDCQDYIDSVVGWTKRGRVIQVIHDAIAFYVPHIVPAHFNNLLSHYMESVLPVCYGIASSSKHTASAVEQNFKNWGVKHSPRFLQFAFGADIDTSKVSRPEEIKQEPYYLTVATLNYGKNIHLLMQVYRLARERGIDLDHLYIAGQPGTMAEEMLYQLDADPYLRTKITRLGSQNNAQMVWLYQNAVLTIFPSFYEAYGLPVAESLMFGKVSLSSQAGALPEVGGQFADYFSPYSPEQLLDLLVKYQNKRIRQKRQSEITAGYSHPTWGEAAERFYNELKLLKLM